MSAAGQQALLAHLRGLLTTEAHVVAYRLQREGLALTAENIATALALAVGTARPRSRLVPWHLDDIVVEKMIAIVSDDLAETFTVAAP